MHIKKLLNSKLQLFLFTNEKKYVVITINIFNRGCNTDKGNVQKSKSR